MQLNLEIIDSDQTNNSVEIWEYYTLSFEINQKLEVMEQQGIVFQNTNIFKRKFVMGSRVLQNKNSSVY